jgi:predicted nucleotidyltransferase
VRKGEAHTPSSPLIRGEIFFPLGLRGTKGGYYNQFSRIYHAILPLTMEFSLLAQELEKSNFIVFALLFGSFAESRTTHVSDIDIGIYTNRDVSLLEIGEIVTRLEKITALKVDLILLNDLYKKKPALAFEIISKGQLILCHEQEKFIEFRKDTFLYYLDTAPLRYLVDQRFRERLNENRSGERNYAGTA